MLEQAHERQFAVCQLGLFSVGFDVEHTLRISHTLDLILNKFNVSLAADHHLDTEGRPPSPHRDDVIYCRPLGTETCDEADPELASCIQDPFADQQPSSPSNQSGRSILNIQNLINPLAQQAKTPKRKLSATFLYPPIAADDDYLSNWVDPYEAPLIQGTLQFSRAHQISVPSATRTRKAVRARVYSPPRATLDLHYKARLSAKANLENHPASGNDKGVEKAKSTFATACGTIPSSHI